MIKRIGVLFVALVVVISLTNCGGVQSPTDGDGNPTYGTGSDEIPNELLGNWLSDDVVDDMKIVMSFYPTGDCDKIFFDAAGEEMLAIRYYDFSINGNIITYDPYWYGAEVETDEFKIDGDSLILDERTYHQVDESFFDGK